MKLANAGRVDDVAAERERDEHGGRRRVAALLRFHADGLHAQCEVRLDCIQERRLADAALAADDAFRASESLAEAVDAEAGRRRYQDHFVTELA